MRLVAAPLSDVNASDARRISVAQVLVYELRVRDAMSKPPITAAPTDTLRAIQHLMKSRRISGVPISDGDNLLGLVSIEDIIRALDKGYIDDRAEQHMTRNAITLRDHFSLVRAVRKKCIREETRDVQPRNGVPTRPAHFRGPRKAGPRRSEGSEGHNRVE